MLKKIKIKIVTRGGEIRRANATAGRDREEESEEGEGLPRPGALERGDDDGAGSSSLSMRHGAECGDWLIGSSFLLCCCLVEWAALREGAI